MLDSPVNVRCAAPGGCWENAGYAGSLAERCLRALQMAPRAWKSTTLWAAREATGLGAACDDTACGRGTYTCPLETAARQGRTAACAGTQAQALYDLAYIEVARARFTRRQIPGPAAVDGLLREAAQAAACDKERRGAGRAGGGTGGQPAGAVA